MRSVYVISAADGPVKIGIADDPLKRLGALQTAHPSRLALVHSQEVGDARLVERVSHGLLKEKRAVGEWFNISPEEARIAVASAIDLIESGDHEALLEKGGSRFPTLTLSPAETELWERLIAQDSGDARGKAKRTLMRALHALDGKNDLTQAEVVEWIQRHTPTTTKRAR